MKYLVTGGAGFIGSHLSELLLRHQHEVIVIDNLSTGKLSNLKKISSNKNLYFIQGDVTNPTVFKKIKYKIDGIFHLAASVGVLNILDHPWETIENNISGTKAVIKYCIEHKNKLIFTSTSEVYGKSQKDIFSESDDHVIGQVQKQRWCYAVSKLMDEHLILSASKKFGFPFVIVRLFNTIGDRQTGQYGMVVPRFIEHALADEPLTVYGSGKQTRCFCYIADVTNALLKLMQNEKANGQVVNLGSTELVSINRLANMIIKLTKSHSKIKYVPYEKAYPEGFEETQRRKPNLKKINKLIGYKPKYSLRQAITRMYQYYLSREK